MGAQVDEKKFEVFFFDSGIAHRILGLNLAEWVTQPLKVELFGFSAEQLVAQEMISYSDPSQKGELYYWHSESVASNAEVDFVTIHDKSIIPVEVKSKIKGGMKSLNVFLNKDPKSPYAIKISEGMFGKHKHLHEIPLYAVSTIKSYLD